MVRQIVSWRVSLLTLLGYGYNSMTLTWGRFVRYGQLQLELTTWDAFSVSLLFETSRVGWKLKRRAFSEIGTFLGGSRYYTSDFRQCWIPCLPDLPKAGYASHFTPYFELFLQCGSSHSIHCRVRFAEKKKRVNSHVEYVPRFKLLLTPWWCNSVTQKLFPFELAGEA